MTVGQSPVKILKNNLKTVLLNYLVTLEPNRPDYHSFFNLSVIILTRKPRQVSDESILSRFGQISDVAVEVFKTCALHMNVGKKKKNFE